MVFRKLPYFRGSDLIRYLLLFFLISGWISFSVYGASSYPEIKFWQNSGSTLVLCNSTLLVQLKDNRFVRFRSTPYDENWIGSEKSPADLGWVYQDEGAKGMEVLDVSCENFPEQGYFTLFINGKKPQFESHISIELSGEWIEEQKKFRYRLSTRLGCKLEDWYNNAKIISKTEVMDFCIEGISTPERMLSPDQSSRTKPLRYEWFVKSHDGETWKKWPKISVPYPVRPGKYITIHELDDLSNVGSRYGFLDSVYGGWITRIEKSPAPVLHEICWARFDLHIQLIGAIPSRGSRENLLLEYVMTFDPIEPDQAKEMVQKAVELPWRAAPEYDLPVLSQYNKFEKMIKDIPSEMTGNHPVWWPSNFNCRQDTSIGYDDHFSLLIDNPVGNKKYVAFSSHAWKYPFTNIAWWNKRIRYSARVKTEGCDGDVRIGIFSTDIDAYYGGNSTFDGNGKPKTNGITWIYSGSVTGTTDWTELALEADFKGQNMTIFLENTGSGKSWFDHVNITLAPPSGTDLISSQAYSIDHTNKVISAGIAPISAIIPVDLFLSYITPMFGVRVELINNQGVVRTTGDLNDGDQLRVTSADGETVVVYDLDIDLTSADPAGNEKKIRVYPNLTSDILTIQGVRAGNHIQVYNSTGVLIDAVKAQSKMEILSLERVPPGNYIIVISNDQQVLGRFKALRY